MYSTARPALTVLKTAPASRGVAKATFIGRLGGTPTVHQTANGKEFVRYSIATNRPPKRDDAGEMVKSEDGFPIITSDWHTIFAFRPNAAASIGKLPAGTQLSVEAVIENSVSKDDPSKSSPVFREIRREVLSFPKKK